MKTVKFKKYIWVVCVVLNYLLFSYPVQAQNGLSNLPSLGDAGGADLSVQDERLLGELIIKDYRAFGSVVNDGLINAYLNRLGERIVIAAGESPEDYEFFLVADPAVNAFALPGGFIGVHTGLIKAARSEDELASVLAHEVAHVSQRHIARLFGRQKEASLVSTAAIIAAVLVASSNPQAAQGLATAGAGYQIDQRLAFTREVEREADRVGYNTLVQAGFETKAMVSFFGRLQQNSRLYENNAPAYLRTHPLTTERIADIQNRVGLENSRTELIEQMKPELSFDLIRMRSLIYDDKTGQQLRDRTEALTSPQALEQMSFFYPETLQYGLSLVYEKQNDVDKALSLINEVIDQQNQAVSVVRKTSVKVPLPLAAQQFRLLIKQRIALNGSLDAIGKNRTQDELNQSDQTLLIKLMRYKKDYSDSLLPKIQYAKGLQSMGLFADSEKFLRDLVLIAGSQVEIYELLARAELVLGDKAEHHLLLARAYDTQGAYRAAIEQTQIAKRFADDQFYLKSEIEAFEKKLKQKVDRERKAAESFKK